MDAAVSDAGLGDAAQPPASAGTQKSAGDCTNQAARACDGHASLTPLLCDGSHWIAQTPCKADERCDTSAGPNEGMCQPIANECLNRQPGSAFCDGNQRRICADLVSSQILPCPTQMQCAMMDDRATCVCAPGSILDGTTCREATSCTTELKGWLRSADQVQHERRSARVQHVPDGLPRHGQPRLRAATSHAQAVERILDT